MHTVALFSLKGGVGTTTLTANLGAALAQTQAHGLIAVDLSPRNQLGIHFGLNGREPGLGHALLRGVGWSRALRQGIDRIGCLPFGELSDEEFGAFEQNLEKNSSLLREGLADLPLEPNGIALFDVAAAPAVLARQALALANLVIVVLLPDAASFATLPVLLELLKRHRSFVQDGDPAAHILLNGVDGTRLTRDVRALLSITPGSPALLHLPVVIHRDEAVREALAAGRTLVETASSSQAAADFKAAAAWLVEELEQEHERERQTDSLVVETFSPVREAGG